MFTSTEKSSMCLFMVFLAIANQYYIFNCVCICQLKQFCGLSILFLDGWFILHYKCVNSNSVLVTEYQCI